MSTKRPPLLSANIKSPFRLSAGAIYGPGLSKSGEYVDPPLVVDRIVQVAFREGIKAARAKDRELIQMAVDYMHKYVEGWVEEHWKEVMCKEENAFLEKAAAQGFKPSEQ